MQPHRSRRTHRGGPRARIALALGVGLFALSSPAVAEGPLIEEVPAPQRVLFIGNSFTYYFNSLHAHVRALTDDLRPKGASKRSFRAMTISNGTLAEHVLGARGMIDRGADGRPWDVVVLQGHSRATLKPASRIAFAEAADTLDGWVRAASSRSMLFMTWAYGDRPEMHETVQREYTRLGNRLAATVAPVGVAFQIVEQERPDLAVTGEDQIHPTRFGTYLAASVFYATLYGASPEGSLYHAGLEPERATYAQRVAWRALQEYRSR